VSTTAAVATAAAAMTVMVVVMTTAAAAAAVAAAAAAATVAGDGHFFTAHKGHSDDRDEHRDSQDQVTVHPRILQQKKQVPWRNKITTVAVLHCRSRLGQQPSCGALFFLNQHYAHSRLPA
jgi:L-alanine-DL-glutamate epimerase-like enolase superfamily enzyme